MFSCVIYFHNLIIFLDIRFKLTMLVLMTIKYYFIL